MADWKKVVVSGSNISQLTNDAGYIASIGGGILSASAAGTDQGQIKLNGVDLDINGLGTTDTPTFAGVTASLEGNVKGDLTGTADTASYVQVGSIDGEILATTASYVAGALKDASIFSATITLTDFAGNETDLVVDDVDQAATASYVAFNDVVSLTAFSASVASQITDTAFDLTFAADGGTNDVIDDGDTVTFAGGTNITSAVTAGEIEFALDADITLTSVTASVKGDVIGNVTGDVTGDLTGTADTASYVQVGSIDGDITAVTASLALAAETLVAGATGADLTLTGDLTVQGTTTTIETANLNVEDQFITLNDGGFNYWMWLSTKFLDHNPFFKRPRETSFIC